MAFRGERFNNKFYIAITVFIFVLIALTVLFSGNQLTKAYIDIKFLDTYLDNGWIDSGERIGDERFFGLEKQFSYKYVIDKESDSLYPAFLTVTSIKTFFMMNEEELLEKTIDTIYDAAKNNNITIDNISKYSGSRTLYNSHQSVFVIFNGTDLSSGLNESVKIIGENWNCPRSSTSIICIGVAQVTSNSNSLTVENLAHWSEIIGDDRGTFNEHYTSYNFINPNGLIFNVKCH